MTQEEIKELIKEMELRVWAFERYRDLHKEVDTKHGYWDGKRSEAAFIVEKLTWILNNTNYPPLGGVTQYKWKNLNYTKS